MRARHEAHHRFERHFHFETRRTGALPARFDFGVFGHCSGNGVGQLTCEPVHDVIHRLLQNAAGVVLPEARADCSTTGLTGRIRRKVCILQDLEPRGRCVSF